MIRSTFMACSACFALAGWALAGETTTRPADPSAPLQFRRVYAPADQVDQWPLGGEPYLPVEAEEFQRLVTAAAQSGTLPPGTGGVQLASGTYRARLVGDDVSLGILHGDAILAFTGHTAEGMFLPLEPLGFAVARAEWDGEPPRSAALGRAAKGRVGVLADGPGRLRLVWSLRGQRGPQGELAFAFDLPRCATNHIVLELPDAFVPVAEHGVVEAGPQVAPGIVPWRIEAGGIHHLVVRLSKADSPAPQPPPLLRQEVAYEFSSRGVDVTAQLHIDVEGAPLRQVTLQLDPRLQLVAARLADRDIPWTASDGATGRTRVVLDLPDPIAGAGRTIRLSALAAVDENQSWHLPRVIVDGMAWLEGSLVLVVPKPLVLDRIAPTDCRQLKTSPLAAPLSGESLEFQCFHDDASIDVVLTRPAENLHVDSGSLIDMGTAGIYCRTVADVSLRQNEQFTITADLGPKWMIDTVEGGDPAAIADWHVDSGAASGTHQLVIALRQSVSPRQPLTLLVSGHRAAVPADGLDSELGLSQLEMLHFLQADFGRHWMAIRAADGHELRIKGASELARIDPKQLTAAESRLFAEPPSGLVFAVDATAARLEVATVPRKPTYAGEINVDVIADGKTLTETYTLRCSSPSARVDRLLFFCSHPRPEPLRFSLAGAGGGQIAARRLSPDEHSANHLTKAGEAWELTLRPPRSGPFEIRAVRSLAFKGLLPLSLAALPEASTQRGSLTVRALGETGVDIDVDDHRLRPIPAELAEGELYPTTRGAYRYEPDEPIRDAASALPAISIRPTSAPAAEAGAWAWRSTLESRYALRDATVHEAAWYVQTAGRARLSFRLPPDAELRSVAVDDVPLSDAHVGGFGSPFTVELPSGKQFATVVVSFVARGRLPRLAGSLSPAWPEVDIPVLARVWNIWLPPGYELTGSDSRWETSPSAAPSWSQRLFGPLGRPAWQTMFNPLQLGDWSALVTAQEDLGSLNAERFLGGVADIVAHADRSQPLEWGRVCDLLAAAPAMSGVEVLVDLPALEQIGMHADSLVPSRAIGVRTDRGQSVIEQAELFLLYNDQVLLLTTAAAVAGENRNRVIDASGATGQIVPGAMAGEIEAAARDGGSPRYVPLSAWSRLSGGPAVPWRHESSGSAGLWTTRGWSVATVAIGSGLDRPVAVVRSAAMQSCAWAIFLMVFAVGIWHPGWSRRWLLAAVLALAAIALVASATYLPLIAAAFMGSLAALAWRAVDRRRPRPLVEQPSRRLVASTAVPLLVLFALSLALGAAVQSWADEPAPSGAPPTSGTASQGPAIGVSAPPVSTPPINAADRSSAPSAANQILPAGRIYRVFVPVDADRRPVGSKVYVPEEMFQALAERAARAKQAPGDWLLTRANYQLQLSRENPQRTVAVAECKASFDLEIFHPGVELEIPLGGEGISPVRGSAKLDGRPIEVDWPAGADHLSFAADQAGFARLEISFLPTATGEGADVGFDATIPSLPMSALTAVFEGEPVALDIPTARGQVVQSAAAGSVQADLGPGGRLSVRWPEERRASANRPHVDVEELLWVKLQAGSPMIDARFKCRSSEGPIRQLRVLADRRLQLLPASDAPSPIVAVHATPGDPVTLDLDLSDASDQPEHEVIVDLAFLVTESSGIGNFHLPRLEASGVHSSGRLLAVTLDPSLHYEEQLGDDVKPQSGADFLAAWGVAQREPQLVYAIPQGMVAWSLATRPTEVRNSVEQLTIYSFGQGSASLHASAVLTTSSGHNFQLRLKGPPGVEIQNVSLVEGGVQRVARWSADDTGAIMVFLTGPVSGRQQFALEGRLSAPRSGEITLPGVQWLDAEIKKNQIEIFRQPTALVEMGETSGVSPLEPTAEERLKPEWGRLVASYAQTEPQAALHVRLARNQPQTDGRQVLIVNRQRDAWTATLDLQLQVRGGLLDVLRFDIPPQWAEPFQFDADVQSEVLPIPGENRRQLVVRPLTAIAGDFSLRIQGHLGPSMGDRLGIADVILRGVGQLERFVILPHRWENEEVVWDTVGLTDAQLPSDLQKRLPLGGGMQAFHVLGEHFQASLKNIEHTSIPPRVHLADVGCVWQADGEYYGVAAFELSPASASRAVLKLPPDMELISLAVADLPTAVTSVGAGAWQFSLGPPQLPQHVEVIFRGTLAGGRLSAGSLRFEAPMLADLEVEKTLWTVYGPSAAGRGTPLDVAPLSATGQELERLEATKSVLGLAAHVASEQLPEEMQHWYSLWKGRMLAAHARVGRLTLTSNQAAARQDLDAWNRGEAEVVRLGIATTTPTAAKAPIFEPLTLLAANVATDPNVVSCKFAGGAPALVVNYPHAAHGDLGWRVLTALLLCGLAALLAWKRPPSPAIRLTATRLVAILAICWWLWLDPSGLGFALLIIAIAAGLIRRLRSVGSGRLTTMPTG
ncbi:MAG TPA: hypothetical protein VMF30_07220 [Pirellulales bacterium]|nr:hypothetical protein [Pirellulales bacterium]